MPSLTRETQEEHGMEFQSLGLYVTVPGCFHPHSFKSEMGLGRGGGRERSRKKENVKPIQN